MAPKYFESFFEYIEPGSVASARVILHLVLKLVPVSRVLDVGCGRGAWLEIWFEQGIRSICGIDGDYVEPTEFINENCCFVHHDLTTKFELGEKFDLVQCLEVAEHLPESAAGVLVDALCDHGDVVMFSAATRGQGGENHINEQPLGYWRDKFKSNGFSAYDPIRPQVAGKDIEPWYKFNILVYVRSDSKLVEKFSGYEAEDNLHNCFPLWWKLRLLPMYFVSSKWVSYLARIKHAIFRRLN